MIVPIFLPHLGCLERCIYCNQGHITGSQGIDVDGIVKKSLCSAKDKVEIGLYGGNIFNVEPAELKRLFECFNSHMEKVSNFRISTKPVPLRNETIEILKVNKVTVIELGIPVFNDAILEKLNRKHTVEDFYKAYCLLKEEGFRVALQVMVGLPDETMNDIRMTAEQIIRLSPHYIRIYPLIVLKDTPLYSMYESGLFVPIPFEEALKRAVYIYLNALKHGIKAAKMGLTDNEIIKERVVAGHYHPAFGYLVKSEAFYLAVKAKIGAASLKGDVTVRLNNRDIPHLSGNRRSNIKRFNEQGVCIAWEKADVEEGNFVLHSGSKEIGGSIFDALLVS